MKPVFFSRPARFRAWLEKHHAKKDELWVGYYRKATGRSSITWPESVEQALCFGWIDGIRKSLDEESYVIRFTPRRTGSIWSARNIETAERLIELGLMMPAGTEAWERRTDSKSRLYSFEQEEVSLGKDRERTFRSNRKAWRHFQSETPGYRRTATWWVISAKREDTRDRRLGILIAESEAGRRIPQLRRPGDSE